MHRYFLAFAIALQLTAVAAPGGPAKKNTPEAQRARSPQGLLIEKWENGGEGSVQVTLRNFTASTVSFNYHELRAVIYQTGGIEAAGDVRFSQSQVASLFIEVGQIETFRVIFPGRRAPAALAWAGSEIWQTPRKNDYLFDSSEKALASEHAAYVAQAVKARSKALKPVKEGFVPAKTGN